jgi:ATP-dependent Clp protease ATP-binding subunit ClpA
MMLSGEVRAASPQGPSQKAKQSKEIGDASYPTLSRCAIDLTERARRGELDPVIGRDRETRRLIEILSAESNESPVVISETGLSASAIADNLAQLMASENPPESLRDKRLFSLSLNTLTDNLTDKNEFTARIQAVLDEVEKSNGRIILVIDQLHQYIGSYAERAVSAALRFKPTANTFRPMQDSQLFFSRFAFVTTIMRSMEPTSRRKAPATREMPKALRESRYRQN